MASEGAGKRAGSRRGAKPPARVQPALLLLALGVTVSVVAWGYLVYAAIDFGSSARGGRGVDWLFLLLASLGAVACLFVGLVLVARLLRALGITGGDATPSGTSDPVEPSPARPPGGRRAAR